MARRAIAVLEGTAPCYVDARSTGISADNNRDLGQDWFWWNLEHKAYPHWMLYCH